MGVFTFLLLSFQRKREAGKNTFHVILALSEGLLRPKEEMGLDQQASLPQEIAVLASSTRSGQSKPVIDRNEESVLSGES